MDTRATRLEKYTAPPRPRGLKGATRRVGLELELGNLSLEEALGVLHRVLGGQAKQRSATQAIVENTRFGTFKLEFDAPTLTERTYLRPLELMGLDVQSETANMLEESVLRVARTVVPLEIVAPPIPWDQLEELDPLWVALQAAGAGGTSSSLLHAFGLHLNPEPPDFEVETVLGILRSFLLLVDWIIESAQIDLSRRVAPFINPFPEAYRRRVLQADYTPDWEEFVDDYLLHNPTRNRPLDLLPLLVHLGAQGLEERVENWSLVKGRPTFHYRLPDSLVSEVGWSPAIDWNRWVVVERLADQPGLLAELSAAYLDTAELPLRWQSLGWVDELRTRLAPLVEDAAFSKA